MGKPMGIMSPLPYQADTTEKIALVNPTTTVPVSSMWKKAGVAMTIGTLFVAGNSWKKGPTSDSAAAAVSVSHLTFGDNLGRDDCDLVPVGDSKDQCTCIINGKKCRDSILMWGHTEAAQTCMEEYDDDRDYERIWGHFKGCLQKGVDVVQCYKDNKYDCF